MTSRARCPQCKTAFAKNGNRQKYCSVRCRDAAQRKRDASKNVAALTSSQSNEWYTPAPYVEAARQALGAIDLDPASSAEANAVVQAAEFYTEKDDGLARDWYGRVWMNPPYGRLAGSFVAHLAAQYAAGNVKAAVILVASSSASTTWFRPLWDGMLCFTDHRINFNSVKGNTTGSIFAYLGPDADAFHAAFSQFGAVVTRWR